MFVTDPCCSAALDYSVCRQPMEETKRFSTSHHSGVLASSHEKQSVMKLRPKAILYIFGARGGRRQAGSSLCWAEPQSHNGHSYYCCSSIHFGNKCRANGTSSTGTPSYSETTQAKHTAKTHDIVCCFSILCS